MGLLRQWFSTPGRQAAGWSSLGILGIVLAAGGFLLLGRGDSNPAQASVASPTATRTASATPTATPSPTPTATLTASPSPTASATANPEVRQQTGGSNAAPAQTAVSEATPEPTAAPVVAGGPYCPNISSKSPPNSVIGLLTSGGVAVPAGATVSIAFDGVPGPSAETAAAGGYRVDYGAAGSECANRVGAGISVIYNGKAYATGKKVGDNPGGALRFDVGE